MHRSPWTRRLALPGLVAPILVVAAAAWATPVLAISYGTPPPSTPMPTAAPTATAAAPSTVQLGIGTSQALGSYLTGPNGMTLYTLSSDPNGGSVCTGQCLGFWPPLLVAAGGSTGAPAGATGTFGSFVRADDGTTQVTHNGRALYYFKNDTAPGQTNGEGIQGAGGVWHVALATTSGAGGTPAASASGGTAGSTGATLPPTDAAAGGGDAGPGGMTAFAILALAAAGALVSVTVRPARRQRSR